MMRTPRVALVSMIAGSLLGSCATTPITVSSDSTQLLPSSSGTVSVAPGPANSGPAFGQLPPGARPCAVHLADVVDLRTDPNDLGMMGLRDVRATDSTLWLKNAVAALSRDPRLRLVDDEKDASLIVRIELIKAYIMTMNTQKSANVVLRVGYRHAGRDDLDTEIARGRETGANWVNGADEAQGALNRALSAAVKDVDVAIVSRCQAG